MKRINFWICLLLLLALTMGTTACSKVPAGHVGVKVYLLGGSKGVESEQLGVGRYWIGFNEELYRFPTFAQNYVWTQSPTEGSQNDESITFQTIEGMSVGADVGITYSVIPEKVSDIFQKYRKQLPEITDVYLRNMVRDAFVNISSKLPVESVYGAGKSKLLKDVEDYVREQVGNMFNIERVYLVGNLRLPKQVTDALNDKIKATQKAEQRENEVRESEANAKKKIADSKGEAQSILNVANAQAEANIILAKSLTTELVSYKSVEKWDGKLPVYSGGGAVPFINIKQ